MSSSSANKKVSPKIKLEIESTSAPVKPLTQDNLEALSKQGGSQKLSGK
jgi:hypothetical protein